MPTGPQGHERPPDLVGCVHPVFQIATGEAEETPVSPHRTARRREIAQEGVKQGGRNDRQETRRSSAVSHAGTARHTQGETKCVQVCQVSSPLP